MLPVREFGKKGLKIWLLGIGTTWFGRHWPPDDASYTYPDPAEIRMYLGEIYGQIPDNETKLMVDTSPAYGSSEERLGEYFRSNKKLFIKTFIATKWGEKFDTSANLSAIDHSKANLIKSLDRSISRLGRVDLLYIHRTTISVLKDEGVMKEMCNIRDETRGGVGYIGASFSDENTLEAAVKGNLIGWMDALQIPAVVFLKRTDLVNQIRNNGISIVLNSPVRRGGNKPPKDIYAEILAHDAMSAILTGTRRHLKETISYFCSAK